MKKAKVLLLDIETSPILAYVWGVWDQNIALNQIKEDWSILAWSAKWLHDPESKIMYQDQRHARDINNDGKILKKIWKLINEADVIVTQNGKQFDMKRLNARFIINGMKPPGSFKHIDTKQIAKTKFGFTSNRLEHMSEILGLKRRKSKHNKFPGFELWAECLKGNLEAWNEMEKYNKLDVLALEDLYLRLQPWDNSFNPNVYEDNEDKLCACGSKEFRKNGFSYTSTGKYQRFACTKCGAEYKAPTNLLSKIKKKQMLKTKR